MYILWPASTYVRCAANLNEHSGAPHPNVHSDSLVDFFIRQWLPHAGDDYNGGDHLVVTILTTVATALGIRKWIFFKRGDFLKRGQFLKRGAG